MRGSPTAARAITFYLPQYHPIPENDSWWGNGFTEWTNVARARRLYPGHYQPHVPADLGFYDLRLPETREAQASLARDCGIEGFCYWHYWFAGRRLLDRPFSEVVASGRPDFPFCLGWANESWSGIWHGSPGRLLMEQVYPGASDEEAHFRALLPAFLDDRYLTVRGRRIFVLYRPHQIPALQRFIDHWQELAIRAGLPGMYFIGVRRPDDALDASELDAELAYLPDFRSLRMWGFVPPALRDVVRAAIQFVRHRASGSADPTKFPPVPANLWPQAFPYDQFVRTAFEGVSFDGRMLPVVVPNWDNTPRCGIKGTILHGSTPDLFSRHLAEAVRLIAHRPLDERLIFIRSWNEWAEGNHLEPDRRHGRGFLAAVRANLVPDRKQDS